jgi:NAD(P)-dependent dehydrogenase (short-subunit alcohol dehydrogenase family)
VPARLPARRTPSATAGRRRCCSRAKAPRSWPSTDTWSLPRRPRRWPARRAAKPRPWRPRSPTRRRSGAAIQACVARYGRLDILHNNVGISVEGGDAPITEIETEAFDRIVAVNLRSVVYACKHALPIMRKQGSGAIVNISSTAAVEGYPWVAYKATKAGMIAMTKQIAIQNAEFGVRANVILPGLMDTPMAVDRRAEAWGRPRAEVAAERDAKVPLGHMGTGWDVAYAALFLASDEAKFITGVALPVDGGKTCRIG